MEALSFLLTYVFSALALTVLVAGLFMPLAVLCIKCIGAAQKKPFYSNMARQMQHTALWFGSLASILVIAAIIVGYKTLLDTAPNLEGLTPEQLKSIHASGVAIPPAFSQIALLGGYFALFVGLLVLGHITWQRIKGRNALQISLSFLTAVCAGAAYTVTFFTIVQTPQLLDTRIFFAIFSWTWALYPFGSVSTAISLLMYAKMLSAGCGIAFSLFACAMLLRRERDDFGRDYYNFAFKHQSVWLSASSALTALCSAGMLYILQNMTGGKFSLNTTELWLGILLCACCAIFWAAVMRSPSPLRHKGGMWINLVALIMALTGHLLFLRSFYFGYGVISGILQAVPK